MIALDLNTLTNAALKAQGTVAVKAMDAACGPYVDEVRRRGLTYIKWGKL